MAVAGGEGRLVQKITAVPHVKRQNGGQKHEAGQRCVIIMKRKAKHRTGRC